MNSLRLRLADHLWWLPRLSPLGYVLLVLPFVTFEFLMLWLGKALVVGALLLPLTILLFLYLGACRIPAIAASEAFALLPRRRTRLSGAMLQFVAILSLGAAWIGWQTGQWGLSYFGLSVMIIPLILFSMMGRPIEKREHAPTAQGVLLALLMALSMLGVALAIKHRDLAPIPLAILPGLYLLGLLGWTQRHLWRWHAPRPASASRWPAWFAISPLSLAVTASQLTMCVAVFSHNAYGAILLPWILPFQSLSLLRPALLRDEMRRRWLAGLPREALWQAALRQALRLCAPNLLLLCAGLELMKCLPWSLGENLSFGQIGLLCGIVPLLLWGQVQLALSSPARDASWWSLSSPERPRSHPAAIAAYYCAAPMMVIFAAGCGALASVFHGNTPGFALSTLALSALLGIAALPVLRFGLRRIEL